MEPAREMGKHPFLVVEPLGHTADQPDLSVPTENIDLQREPFGKGNVVLLLDLNVVARGLPDQPVHGRRQSSVDLMAQHPNSWLRHGNLTAEGVRVIGAPVIENDQFPVATGLALDRGDRVSEIARAIEDWHHDRDFRDPGGVTLYRIRSHFY